MKFTIPGKAQGKARARTTIRGNHVHSYTPEKTELYENWIKTCYLQTTSLGVSGEKEPISMTITAYFEIPKSMKKWDRLEAEKGLRFPLGKPDADNIGKTCADALNGLAYKDDSAIVNLTVCKRYGTPERVEVEILEGENI